jgi:hypothetical protein
MPETPIRDERRFVAAARHAAQGAGNPSRLMDGEDIESVQPADARHWVSVYSELLAFKQKTLDHMYHDLQELARSANEEIRRIDVPLIEGEQLRYRKRLHFWQARAHQPAYPTAFYSPFQTDREHQAAPPPEEDKPVLALNLSRRQYD